MSVACVSFCVLWEKAGNRSIQFYFPEIVSPRKMLRHQRTRSYEEMSRVKHEVNRGNLFRRKILQQKFVSGDNPDSLISGSSSSKTNKNEKVS